jgi:hypothetical protein
VAASRDPGARRIGTHTAITLASLMAGWASARSAQRLLAAGGSRALFGYGICELLIGASGRCRACARGGGPHYSLVRDQPGAREIGAMPGHRASLRSAAGATLPLPPRMRRSNAHRMALRAQHARRRSAPSPPRPRPSRRWACATPSCSRRAWMPRSQSGDGPPDPEPRACPRRRAPPADRALVLSAASGASIHARGLLVSLIRAAYDNTTRASRRAGGLLGSLALGAALAVPLQRSHARSRARVGVGVCAPPRSSSARSPHDYLRWRPHPAACPARLRDPGAGHDPGAGLPWLLERHACDAYRQFYAANTSRRRGAVVAGFVLLPQIGATHTSWLAAASYALSGRCGRERAPGCLRPCSPSASRSRSRSTPAPRANAFRDSPPIRTSDRCSTSRRLTRGLGHISPHRHRKLVIDGFAASGEGVGEHYMPWMGIAGAGDAPARSRARDLLWHRPDRQRGAPPA